MIHWNMIYFDEFSRLALLNQEELKILQLRIKGYSITQIAYALNLSEATVSRRIKQLKEKYDEVQKYSDILPLREK